MSDPLMDAAGADSAWTTVNIGEAFPGLFRPLSWSALSGPCERGLRRGFHDLGALTRDELEVPARPEQRLIAVFYGRCAASVDTLRMISDRTPGTSGDSFERQIFGAARANQPSHRVRWRYPLALAKTAYSAATVGRRLRRLSSRIDARWSRVCIEQRDRRDATEIFFEGQRLLAAAFRPHMTIRMLGQGLFDQLSTVVRSSAPDLDVLALGGGHRELEEATLVARLLEVAGGSASLESFLARYGFHGPSEGDLATLSWREDPAPLLALLDVLRSSSDQGHGGSRRDDQRAQGASLLGRVPVHRRTAIAALVRATDHFVVLGEQSKATFLKALDVLRYAARRRGAELVGAGVLAGVEDVFFLTVDEAFTPGLTAASARDLYTQRYARHLEYRDLQLPQSWIGQPRPKPRPGWVAGAGRITGASGAPGQATGTARVVLDAAEAELGEGEILVCETTDPGWAPHIYLAAALVVDMGSAMSHGAIVARELGVPCVIGTADGTQRIRTGDQLAVDGSAGTVTILRRASAEQSLMYDVTPAVAHPGNSQLEGN